MDALVLKLGEVGSSALAASRKATKLNDVWELRPKPYRILYFFDKDAQHYVLLQGFRKASRETPPGEIRQAERMRRAYYARRDQGETPWQIQR